MNTTIKPLTDTVRLYGWTTFEEGKRPILALLFGEMVKRTIPITGHYLSDLYHDALWMERNINGAERFYFIARQWGTHIGTGLDEMKIAWDVSQDSLSQIWQIDLMAETDRHNDGSGYWVAQFTNLTPVLGRRS